MARVVDSLARLQGLFYILTGFWPVVHVRSFELVTGPKDEHWLVKTTGLMIGVTGSVLTLAGVRRRATEPEIVSLAAGSAASLAAIDIIYWKKGRLWMIYLLDAAVELIFATCWLLAWVRKSR